MLVVRWYGGLHAHACMYVDKPEIGTIVSHEGVTSRLSSITVACCNLSEALHSVVSKSGSRPSTQCFKQASLTAKMSFPKDEKTTVVSSEAESNAGEKEQSFKVQTSSVDEPQYDFDSEEFSSIPELVRNVVSFEDDSTLPVITFRSVLLSIVFCIIGSVISQMS